jgi:tetratricopeptide (TPR) repeat protein
MIGKCGDVCSEPFFGTGRKMLANLVFETDDEIKRQKYVLVKRVRDGSIEAVTRGVKNDGTDWIIWMKAMPVYEDQGDFVTVIGIVRDVTATFGDIIIDDPMIEAADKLADLPLPEAKQPSKGLFKKIIGNPSARYKEGVNLYVREKKFKEALGAFDEALAIDNNLPYVWNDQGTCLRELGDFSGALKSVSRAVEIDPDNPEFLFNLGETLEMIGVMNMSNKYLGSAIQSFKKVVTFLPDNASSWNHLGICFMEMGQTEESKFYFDRARDITLWKKDTPIVRKRDEFL